MASSNARAGTPSARRAASKEGVRHDALIADLLPPGVASAEAFGDIGGVKLFPAEEDVVARAVDLRRHAFTTARHCAREALSALGVGPVAIPQGERGAPCWPEGIVGSITHCACYRAAAVAWKTTALAVGIDAEPNGTLPRGVLGRVTRAAEREHLVALGYSDPAVSWDRLLFSAKEAVYKAWYPLTRRELGFMDATVTFYPRAGTFTARLHVDCPSVAGTPLDAFRGRWLALRGLLITVVVLTKQPDLSEAGLAERGGAS